MGFVARLEAQARTLLRHHLDTATSEFALSLLMSTVSLEPVAASYQQQSAVMPPPGGRRAAAAAAAAAAADDGENMPPQDDASDEGQVRVGLLEGWSSAPVLPRVPLPRQQGHRPPERRC
jgi:hypothetical protein